MKAVIAILAALVCLGALFWFYTAPRAPADMTEAEIAQYEAEVTQAIAEVWADFPTVMLSADAEGFLSLWTQDMRILEPGMDLARAGFEGFIHEFWDGGGAVTAFEAEPFEVFVHGDVAYQIGQYRETVQFPDAEPEEAHNNFFARWKKQPDGTWKIDRFVAGPVDAPEEG
jgi:uncharacterized protein (TIGR02246 family)